MENRNCQTKLTSNSHDASSFQNKTEDAESHESALSPGGCLPCDGGGHVSRDDAGAP